MFSTCNNDDSFGPGVSGCRDDFDFTIGFEQLVFSVVPSALFIILAIWRIALFMRRPQIVHAPTLRLVKLGTIAILAALEFVLLILAAIRSLDITSLAIASTALRFVAALCMIPLSVSDHGRLARPSVLLSIYLFPTLLLDAAQTRTYWLAASTRPEVTYTAIFTASLSLKATILILEARSKTKWLNIKEPYSPEETSSIYSLGVFFWLNKIFLTGYRKVMDLKDLYPLDRAIGGEALYKRFQKHAVYSKMQGDKHGLAKALVRTLRVPIMFVILPRLALTAFTFCQPFLINSILDRLSQPVTDASVNVGYGLIGATALIYAGIAVSTALYWYFHYRTLLMARGVLVTAIYTKATQAQIGPGDSSASLTLMSVDIERIVIGFSSLHEAWAGNIEVVLASWLLYNKVGAAFAAPIVIVVLCFLALSVIVKFTGNAQRMWMAGVQKRVGLTSTVISNMKNIKVSGLAAPITEFVQNLRVDELNAGSRLRKLNLITTALAFGPLFVSPIMTFAIAQRTLDATTLFTSLSWLVLLATPLTNVIKTIQLVMSGLACLGRIQAFLESPPRKDYRLVPSNANQELEKVSIDTIHAPNRRERGHANPAITVSNGRFGWEEDTAVLNGIDIKVPESSLTIVVGPIGSGKSTLCKSLLGEIPFSRGSVAMSTKIGRVAYCDQTPFLSNSSIRNNILGFSPFDHQRYADVIDATMLRLDFETLPQGDETNIGRHIIVLGIDGSVVEQGSFEDLVANENYVHSLRLAAQRSESDSDTSESKDSLTDIKPTVVGLASSTTPVVPKVPATARQLGDWTVYKHYFKSMGLVLAGSLFWWAALYGFFYNFPTIWLKYWSDDDSTNNPRHSFSYYMGIYAFLQSFCLVSLVALGYFIWVTSIKKSGAHLHHDALRTMIGAPLQFFTTTDQGVITNLFSQDLNLVDTELPNALLNFLCNFAIAIGQAAVMITTSPYIAISYPFLLFLMWLIQKFYLRTSRQLRILDLETKSPLYTHFIDTTRGIVTIRAFNYVSEEHSKSVALLDDSQRPFYLLLMVQQWLTLVLNLIVMVLAIILVTLALQLRSNSGFAGASLVTLMSFGDSLSSIVMQWTKLETSIGAIGRLRTFSDTVEPESMEGEDISPPVDWPPRGQIDFQGVSASYDTGTPGEELNLALNEVHLSISPGEKVALCGRTGSGKSSIIALLLKLLNPTEDTRSHVYIDNAPLHRIDRQALRLRLIAIPQDAVFLPDGSTFQQNLDPLDVADATECRAALELVGLWVVVEERGGLDGAMKSDTLSQGQRQLFSVAHAVLRRRIRARSLGITTGGGSNGGVLLLDEVTSSVDQETESIIQNIIKVEFQDYTILAVSHRLRFVMDFDRVVVMDRGKVVEVGNPKELAEGDTRFGDLWRAGGR